MLAMFETPPKGARTHRGAVLPPCVQRSYSRTHGLRLVAYFTPSSAPSSVPAAMPISRPLSLSSEQFELMEKEGGEAQHGRLDLEVIGKVRLPIPRWLLPAALLRWFVPFVFRLACPHLSALNRHFDGSALHKRVRSDRSGFYTALRERMPAMRRHGRKKYEQYCSLSTAGTPRSDGDNWTAESLCRGEYHLHAAPPSLLERMLDGLRVCFSATLVQPVEGLHGGKCVMAAQLQQQQT
mmetsp:Transcript_1094/g.3020  ORF Transcript_1094/g.3020 Transcript_1094/m.3020 type:complete len:238 (-) Transcript_1094:228-941(-)